MCVCVCVCVCMCVCVCVLYIYIYIYIYIYEHLQSNDKENGCHQLIYLNSYETCPVFAILSYFFIYQHIYMMLYLTNL